MKVKGTQFGLMLLILINLMILPGVPADAQPSQCMICDNVVGENVCLSADPPNIAYHYCSAGEICIYINRARVCFENSCYQSNLCILYL